MLFGTNGVRGKFNELTPELSLKISQGIGEYFGKGKIGVARDARLTGECLEHSVISGLASVGCEVINLGIISSPTAEFMIKKLKLDGLIIITASHNPPEWNALKVVDGKGVSISRERGMEIEKKMQNIKRVEWKKVKKVEKYSDAVENHINGILKLIGKEKIEKIKNKKLKIVLDSGNGTAATIAPELFKKIGCEIIELNCKLDGNFPGRLSEPTKENVNELIELVKKEKADAGIAWDGDGDRVIFVDEKGEYILGDKVFALSLILKLRENKNKPGKNNKVNRKINGNIVTTVATSKMIEDIGSENNIKTIYTKVGAPYLSEEMSKGNLIAGEEVGGVIWPEISLAKDGIYTGVKLLEALCEQKLSEWIKEIPEYYLEKIKINVQEKEKDKLIGKIKEYAEKNKLNTINVDGIRINFKDGWVIARSSGTEPVIRIFAEGKTKEKAKELLEKLRKIIS